MLAEIKKHLTDHPWMDRIQYFSTIDSTNTYGKQLAQQGSPAGTIIIAGHQSAGRGRLGRSFSSPKNMGLYMSVILRPDCTPSEIMHLTCATAVAAVNAIDNPQVAIKWTNDLVMGKRKLGGILTELSVNPTTQKVDWVIVGIGINCCQESHHFPPEIRQIACSLGIDQQAIPLLAAKLIQSLYQMDQGLLSRKEEIMAAFIEKCVTIGSEISVVRGDDIRHGKAIGLDADGGLMVEYPDGSAETVTSGEVSIRGMYGYL